MHPILLSLGAGTGTLLVLKLRIQRRRLFWLTSSCVLERQSQLLPLEIRHDGGAIIIIELKIESVQTMNEGNTSPPRVARIINRIDESKKSIQATVRYRAQETIN